MNALVLKTKYSVTNQSTVIFNDCTPLWDSVLAPGGYDPTGISGYDPHNTDTSTFNLKITRISNNTSTNISIPAGTENISNIGGTGYITYEISTSDYTFEQELYAIEYSFVDSTNGLMHGRLDTIAVTNQLQCCLDNKLKAIKVCKDCDYSGKVQALFEARMMLEQINLLLECKEYTGAQLVLDYLNDFCGVKSCNCN